MEFLVSLSANTTKDTVQCAQDTSVWCTRYQIISYVWLWFTTIDNTILLLISSILFFIVVFKRKIRDPFVIVQLTCYILANIAFVIYEIILFYETPKKLAIIDCFGRLFYLLGHWAFASKYLRTSYVLPNLLVQTDLDFMHRRTS